MTDTAKDEVAEAARKREEMRRSWRYLGGAWGEGYPPGYRCRPGDVIMPQGAEGRLYRVLDVHPAGIEVVLIGSLAGAATHIIDPENCELIARRPNK